APPPEVLPESVGEWRRGPLRSIPNSEAPDLVTRKGLKRIQEADYEGPGALVARIYELTSDPIGLDLAQRWRPEPNAVFFYNRNYFGVVKWQRAERKALEAFVRDLERKLAS